MRFQVVALLGIKRDVRARANLACVKVPTLYHTRTHTHTHTHTQGSRRAVQGGPSASGKWVKRINLRWQAALHVSRYAQQKQYGTRHNVVTN